MAAQLLVWPATGVSSLADFSENVLSLVECVDALQSRLQQDGGYPEDHALFCDLPRTHNAILAAAFVASAQETLWEPNEATTHVTEQLYRLETEPVLSS